MKKGLFFLLCWLVPHFLWATPTALEILRRVDQNLTTGNLVTISSFVIHGARKSRTIKVQTWTQGRKRSFSEYLAPPREKGTKMLKIENNLWTYYPRADRVVKIAGHMLRQAVMGSDLSYEDMMESNRLAEDYVGVLEGEIRFMDRSCWILGLEAKKQNTAYQFRKLWVDQERFLSLKEELYAKSGKLLKIVEIREVFRAQERWYPRKVRFKDVLKKGEGTEIHIHNIDFETKIPASRFSKAALRR